MITAPSRHFNDQSLINTAPQSSTQVTEKLSSLAPHPASSTHPSCTVHSLGNQQSTTCCYGSTHVTSSITQGQSQTQYYNVATFFSLRAKGRSCAGVSDDARFSPDLWGLPHSWVYGTKAIALSNDQPVGHIQLFMCLCQVIQVGVTILGNMTPRPLTLWGQCEITHRYLTPCSNIALKTSSSSLNAIHTYYWCTSPLVVYSSPGLSIFNACPHPHSTWQQLSDCLYSREESGQISHTGTTTVWLDTRNLFAPEEVHWLDSLWREVGLSLHWFVFRGIKH